MPEISALVRALSRHVRGRVLEPSDRGFGEACSISNGRFDRRPDVVVQCRDAGDVRTAVKCAREEGLALSVKGAGHSYAGKSLVEGGLLVDLSPMKSIHVDAGSATATVAPGVTCGELDRATQEHGLATPLPTVSTVGVAGAALGGGSGYLSRQFGLTLDNLIAVELVTADGQQLRASAHEHPDLFWAMRGAGPNFGIATSLELRLHEVGPEVLAGQIIYPFDDAASLLRSFRAFMVAAPEGFQCYPFMIHIPPVDPFAERLYGHPALDFVVFHIDPDAADFVRPLRELGETILDVVEPAAYTAVQQTFDAALPRGQRYYSRAHYLDELSDGSVDTLAAHAPDLPGAFSAAYLEPLGGAIGRVDPSATAFAGRSAAYSFHILAGWVDAADDRTVMATTRRFHDAMAPHATGGVYVNLLGDDENERVPAAYGENYPRLVALKAEWDPNNLFRMNYNIEPPA